MTLIARVEGFIAEQQHTVAQMRIEIADDMAGVRNVQVVLTEKVAERLCEETLTDALPAT